MTAATLGFSVGSCPARHTVEVEEQAADEVRVTVTARGAGRSIMCADHVTVVLKDELNDRILLDGSTGQPVEVQDAD